MTFFRRYIGNKILGLVGVVIGLSMLGLVAFYTRHQEKSILEQHHLNIANLTETVTQGLHAIMLGGYADIAQNYAKGLKRVEAVEDFRLLRISGLEAFQDNATIQNVNDRLGEEEFIPREQENEVRVYAPDFPELKQALENKKPVSYYHKDSIGNDKLTFLVPLLNDKECFRCHGKDKPVRGILKLTTSLEGVHLAIQATRNQAYQVLFVALLGGIVIIYILIRRSVVQPIGHVTRAMMKVSEGDFTQTVPVIGEDELSRMAHSFNQMSMEVLRSYSGLQQEQNKLTTIILSAREAIIVTNPKGDIVLVNPAAERLLEKSTEEIMAGGFFNIVDDPDFVQAFMQREGKDIPDTLVYKNRILNFSASTIRTADGQSTGSAALIRDITEEKRLEEHLRSMSYTDKLTGLFNRRRLEDLLKQEFSRARRFSLDFSLLFFDVDHFKKFNDTYGHDMGDRVLEELGRQLKLHFRTIDFPCRYGGEEFCVLLPGTSKEGAFIAADRLRIRIMETAIDGVHVTISIGICSFLDHHPRDEEHMRKCADNALYQAKHSGRNRVMVWEPSCDEILEKKP